MPTSPRVRYKGRGRADGVEPRPYGSATRGAMGGRPQGSPLRKRYKGGQGRAESPSHGFAVTAPFRQGNRGDGGTDCHSQCAHWLRNDRVFHGVRGKAGRVVREADPYGGVTRSADGRADVDIGPYGGLQEVRLNGSSGKSAKRCQWRMKRADFEEVPRLAATKVAGNRLARRWATADPYGRFARSLRGGRPRGSPLRRGCKRCGESEIPQSRLRRASLL